MIRKINKNDVSADKQLDALKKRIQGIKSQLTSKSLSGEKRQQLQDQLRSLIQKLRQ